MVFELKLPFNVDFNEYLRYLPFTDIIIFLKLKQWSLENVSKVLEYRVFFRTIGSLPQIPLPLQVRTHNWKPSNCAMNFYNIRKEHGSGVSNTFVRSG